MVVFLAFGCPLVVSLVGRLCLFKSIKWYRQPRQPLKMVKKLRILGF